MSAYNTSINAPSTPNQDAVSKILSREFYSRAPLVVAREIIGKKLVRTLAGNSELSGIIVEAEAYGGAHDPASHAYRGKTARNEVMFGEPGHAYVYFTYGAHYCLNFVTKSKMYNASAVLVRAIEPVDGIEVMEDNRGTDVVTQLTSGPGKLCQAFCIDKSLNGVDLTKIDSAIRVEDVGIKPHIARSIRIGISVAVQRKWRFYAISNLHVSKRTRLKAAPRRES